MEPSTDRDSEMRQSVPNSWLTGRQKPQSSSLLQTSFRTRAMSSSRSPGSGRPSEWAAQSARSRRTGLHNGAPFPHGGAAAANRHRHNGRLRLDRHDEAALLERQEVTGAASGALGKIRNELPARRDAAPAAIAAIARLAVARVRSARTPRRRRPCPSAGTCAVPPCTRCAARMQRLEQHRRVDVALVVRAEDHGRSPGTCSRPATRYLMPAERQRQPDPACPRAYIPASTGTPTAMTSPSGAATAM